MALTTLRVGVSVANLIPYLYICFAYLFPEKQKLNPFLLVLSLPVIVISILSLTSLVVVDVEITSAGANVVNPTILYSIHSLSTLLLMIAGFLILLIKRKKLKAMQITQIDYILLATVIAYMTNLIVNAVLPLVGLDVNLVLLGTISLVIFNTIITFAIVRHRLFDIRPVVARSVTYLLTIGALGSIYSAIVLVLGNYLFNFNKWSTAQQVFNIASALFVGITFEPIKSFFDRLTNKIFYRDAYDLKRTLDSFSAVLVASIDLNLIIKETRLILDSTVHPQFLNLYFPNSEGAPYTYDSREGFSVREDFTAIFEKLEKSERPLNISDDSENIDKDMLLVMQRYDIVAAIRLETKTGIAGYMLLGPRLNGAIYNSQDITLLTIMSNQLALAVQNAIQFAQVSSFNLTLQKKVDDATVELRKTNEKLKELDQAKDEFISMASHQLRTPLTSVKGYVSMVLDGDVGEVPSEQKELLKQAFTSSQRMVYLISDLLNVSRLRTGKFVIENKDTNLADLVKTELEQLYETAESRGLKLVYDKPKRFPMVPIDETKIRQVVMNFVDNAIYYTPKGGTITVEVKETPKTIEFTSSDTGIGISKEAQKSLFGKFFRADNAKKARPDGTGLGLYMAKKVIVAQGGSLIFHSEEGKGSTFGFSLPKNIADRPKEMPSLEDEQEAPQASVAKTDHQIATAAGTHTIDENPNISEVPNPKVAKSPSQ